MPKNTYYVPLNFLLLNIFKSVVKYNQYTIRCPCKFWQRTFFIKIITAIVHINSNLSSKLYFPVAE